MVRKEAFDKLEVGEISYAQLQELNLSLDSFVNLETAGRALRERVNITEDMLLDYGKNKGVILFKQNQYYFYDAKTKKLSLIDIEDVPSLKTKYNLSR
jgi:hypothetical protein